MRQIKAIHTSLPSEAARSLVNAFVVSRLDYCNGLYAKLPWIQLEGLQSVFNAAEKLIFGASKYWYMKPQLQDHLLWLMSRKNQVQVELNCL